MINHIKSGIIVLSILVVTYSCEKPNTASDIYSYKITEPETDGKINPSDNTIILNFPSGFVSGNGLTAEFSISDGAIASIGDVVQISGETSNNYKSPLTLQIVAEDEVNVSEWKIIGINNEYTFDWGLGGFLEESFSSERDYGWYLDQGDTKEFKYDNCGPTSTVMAAKWSDGSFTQTPDDARAAYRSDGGWWYTDDISNYLTDYGIPHIITELGNSKSATEQIIKSKLDDGYLALLCLDMYYISTNTLAEERVDKFYYADSPDWGHFIIVKGYRIVDENLFFEVYDPYNFGKRYHDGSPKGKNRYYKSEDIYSASKIWWNYAFFISEKNKIGFSVQSSRKLSEIEHKWGR